MIYVSRSYCRVFDVSRVSLGLKMRYLRVIVVVAGMYYSRECRQLFSTYRTSQPRVHAVNTRSMFTFIFPLVRIASILQSLHCIYLKQSKYHATYQTMERYIHKCVTQRRMAPCGAKEKPQLLSPVLSWGRPGRGFRGLSSPRVSHSTVMAMVLAILLCASQYNT